MTSGALEAFEIADVISSTRNNTRLAGRALVELNVGDELFWLTDGGLVNARIAEIKFRNSPIDQIEPPHACTLTLKATENLKGDPQYLYRDVT